MLRKYLTRDNKYLEWFLRILFTLNFVVPGINYEDEHYYPGNVLLMVIIGLWLYFFRLKVVSVVPLLYALFINYLHTGNYLS